MTHDKMAVTAKHTGINSPEFPNYYNSLFHGLFILKTHRYLAKLTLLRVNVD